MHLSTGGARDIRGECIQVGTYFWSIYRQVRPSVEQHEVMTEIWGQWKRRKRKLDEDLHEARALLEALPAHVPLPHDFLAHLNALVATRLLTSPAPASTVAGTQNQVARQHTPCATVSSVLYLQHCAQVSPDLPPRAMLLPLE